MMSADLHPFGLRCEYLINPLGIQPGYQHILIRPQSGAGLSSARAEYASIRGKIISAWRLEGDVFSLEVMIPANTTATVSIPAKAASDVAEGAEAAGEAEGVRFVCQDADRALFEISSGSYHFISHLPQVASTA